MKEKIDAPSGKRVLGCRKLTSRGCLIGVAVIAVLAVTGWYVLMGQAAAPQTSSYEINLPRIRQMAQESPGKLPIRLNSIVVGNGSYPQVMVIAGTGLQSRKMVFTAFQLVYEDHTVIIDSTFPKVDYDKMFPGGRFDAQNYDSLQRALQESSLVLLTHAHVDHIAGITRSPEAISLMPKVTFTQEQLADASTEVGMTAELLAQVHPITYQDYYLAAPGVVLMKAPGHTQGDQMIYVRLQDGNEFLLVGDVVWSNANIIRATGRPLLERLVMHEDWEKNSNVIRALHDLVENETIHMLVSHDGLQLEEYIREGLIGGGFE